MALYSYGLYSYGPIRWQIEYASHPSHLHLDFDPRAACRPPPQKKLCSDVATRAAVRCVFVTAREVTTP